MQNCYIKWVELTALSRLECFWDDVLHLTLGTNTRCSAIYKKACVYLHKYSLLVRWKSMILNVCRMPFIQECVRGALKGKTIILVTHQVDFLHNVDQILVSLFFLMLLCFILSSVLIFNFIRRIIQILLVLYILKCSIKSFMFLKWVEIVLLKQ